MQVRGGTCRHNRSSIDPSLDQSLLWYRSYRRMLTSRSRSYRQHRRISVVEIGTYDLRDESEEKLNIIVDVSSDLSSVPSPMIQAGDSLFPRLADLSLPRSRTISPSLPSWQVTPTHQLSHNHIQKIKRTYIHNLPPIPPSTSILPNLHTNPPNVSNLFHSPPHMFYWKLISWEYQHINSVVSGCYCPDIC